MRGRRVVAIGVVTLGGVFALAVLLAIAAAIDNKLGWLATHDERVLRRAVVHDTSVETLVRRQYQRVEWSAYHADELYRTVVDCNAIDASGHEVNLSWEVAHWYTPRADVKRRSVFITALNREAAALTPPFAVPDLPLRFYPHGAQFSETVYGAAAKELGQ